MPTDTVHAALIKMGLAVPGAPWCYETWQDITGITSGINPAEDHLLPKGWSRSDANAVQEFLTRYAAIKSEEERRKFAGLSWRVGVDVVPGRALWRTFITTSYTKIWKIHRRISDVLEDSGVHPMQLMVSSGDFDDYPPATSYLPVALDHIGRALFGDEALDKGGRLLRDLREPTLSLAQRTWQYLQKSHARSLRELRKLEEKMDSTMKCRCHVVANVSSKTDQYLHGTHRHDRVKDH